MHTIKVNNESSFKVNLKSEGQSFEGSLNEMLVKGDLMKVNDFQYNLLYNSKSYNIQIHKFNKAEKTLTLKINSVKYTLEVKDKLDELLHSLGMDNATAKKVNSVKAPMPGLVLNVLVTEGAEVKKGDVLLVLEAMKMENMLKSPTDGIIKKIAVEKGNAVEKNQLLIQF